MVCAAGVHLLRHLTTFFSTPTNQQQIVTYWQRAINHSYITPDHIHFKVALRPFFRYVSCPPKSAVMALKLIKVCSQIVIGITANTPDGQEARFLLYKKH